MTDLDDKLRALVDASGMELHDDAWKLIRAAADLALEAAAVVAERRCTADAEDIAYSIRALRTRAAKQEGSDE